MAPSENVLARLAEAGDHDAGISSEDTLRVVFAEVISLLLLSPEHRNMALYELERLVMPLLKLGQFRLVRQKGRTVGYASWAYFNQEAERAFVVRHRPLRPEEWNSGQRCWWIDLVAPYGGLTPITAKVRDFCPDDKALFLRRGKDDRAIRVCEWHKPSRSIKLLAKLPSDVSERHRIYAEAVEPVLRASEAL